MHCILSWSVGGNHMAEFICRGGFFLSFFFLLDVLSTKYGLKRTGKTIFAHRYT